MLYSVVLGVDRLCIAVVQNDRFIGSLRIAIVNKNQTLKKQKINIFTVDIYIACRPIDHVAFKIPTKYTFRMDFLSESP